MNLTGKKAQRKLLVLKMVVVALEEFGGRKTEFSTLLNVVCQYGAKLEPPIKEGEAESVLVWVMVHF